MNQIVFLNQHGQSITDVNKVQKTADITQKKINSRGSGWYGDTQTRHIYVHVVCFIQQSSSSFRHATEQLSSVHPTRHQRKSLCGILKKTRHEANVNVTHPPTAAVVTVKYV